MGLLAKPAALYATCRCARIPFGVTFLLAFVHVRLPISLESSKIGALAETAQVHRAGTFKPVQAAMASTVASFSCASLMAQPALPLWQPQTRSGNSEASSSSSMGPTSSGGSSSSGTSSRDLCDMPTHQLVRLRSTQLLRAAAKGCSVDSAHAAMQRIDQELQRRRAAVCWDAADLIDGECAAQQLGGLALVNMHPSPVCRWPMCR